jgi:diguanylate cyclase (GGDEF)-like protein
MKQKLTTEDQHANRGIVKKIWASDTALRHGLVRATEPHILYPAIAVLALAAIWGTTLNLIEGERAAAEHTAAVSAHQLAETYEAQVVRALREIDQTLMIVKYANDVWGPQDVLQKLKARALLPPTLVFVVSIADSEGNVVASTRPSIRANVADQDIFQRQRQRQADVLAVGRPRPSPDPGEWEVQFSRRLSAPDGRFSGIAMISVAAGYFVSGYDATQFGEHGMIGILGTDGVFRAWRSGDTVSAGDRTDFSAVAAHAEDETGTQALLTTNTWDGMRRYTRARQLYDFPLAVIVGLAADEQLAATRRDSHTYLWRATASSALLILIVAVLGRMSRQLALSRQRAVEEHIAHAERVEYLAYHDGLTTLPNRRLFSELLRQSINQAVRHDRQLAVLFLDLDHFKHINDTRGHEAGDQLLQEVATRLKACLRGSDTVARLGGDEFVVLLPELDEEKYVHTVAQKILSAVAMPFVLSGKEYRVTASIGISAYPQDGLDEKTLIKNADSAMYQAKKAGHNKFQFYSG